jgi:hypothetical protein
MGQISSRIRRGRNDVVRVGRRLRKAGSLPGFVIIGAQRGGTTTLFHSLLRHPMIGGPARKEVHYFDSAYARGELWYRSFFPSGRRMERDGQRLTGEATPSYLFHPLAAQRAADTLPEAKFVAVLRDPVARAWSHHAHQVALGYETLPFEAAIEAEAERLAGEEERILSDPAFQATRFRRVSYLARGDYAPQLDRWFSAVGRGHVLVLISDEFFGDPPGGFRQVEEFLGLSWTEITPLEARFAKGRTGLSMSSETHDQLQEHFAPRSRRLEALLGRKLPWGRGPSLERDTSETVSEEGRPSFPAGRRGDTGS